MRGLTFADGFFPFCPSTVDKYGDPYEHWDGTTTYNRATPVGFGTLYSKAPSKSSSEDIAVYGAGSLYPLGLTLEQATEFYWRWKSFVIRVAGGAMPALTVAAVSVETFSPDYSLGAPNYISTTETGSAVTIGRDVSSFPDPLIFYREKYYVAPDWRDYTESRRACGLGATSYPTIFSGYTPAELTIDDPSPLAPGGQVTGSSSLTLMTSLFPGSPPPTLPTPFLAAPVFLFAENKYWLKWDVGFAYNIAASRNESRYEPKSPWPDLEYIEQFTTKSLSHVTGLRIQSTPFTGATIKSVPVQIVFRDATVVAGNVYSNSIYTETNGADGSSPISGLTADFIPPTQSLEPLKFWTYGGIYNETTGEPV